jgi:hypothetical protein
MWRHDKKCLEKNKITETNESKDINDKNLILMLIKQNSELLEVIKNCPQTINNNNNNNSNNNNNTFNLHFFLNETCKNAMNIMDFIDSIQLQITDLENVGKNGYIEGISNIITSNLKALDITERPIHCTDKKREVIYIKDENKWEKEDESNKKIRKVIKKVASKNLRLLTEFKKLHPDCIKSSSKFSDQYNKIIVGACGGSGDNDIEKENIIIKNISKVITINKNI